MIVFAGGMTAAGEAFLNRIQHYIRELAFPIPAAKTIVRYAQLGSDAGFIGARRVRPAARPQGMRFERSRTSFSCSSTGCRRSPPGAMFGGWGLYSAGTFSGIVWKDRLYLRVGPDSAVGLRRPGDVALQAVSRNDVEEVL